MIKPKRTQRRKRNINIQMAQTTHEQTYMPSLLEALQQTFPGATIMVVHDEIDIQFAKERKRGTRNRKAN